MMTITPPTVAPVANRPTWRHEATGTFCGVASSPALVRAFVAEHLTGSGADVEAAILAASELATNAVLHSRSRDGEFTVWVGHTERLVEVAVVDDGPLPNTLRDEAIRPGGWGLARVVPAVTTDHGHHHDSAGRRVAWFRLAIPDTTTPDNAREERP
jgi:hypothetical protein